jgi:hypothetical protein
MSETLQLEHVSSPISYRPNQTATATGFVGLALPILSTYHSIYHLKIGCRHSFIKPLQFIVIAVMAVMSGTFADTYGVFYMTVSYQCIWGPSYHCHVYRQ